MTGGLAYLYPRGDDLVELLRDVRVYLAPFDLRVLVEMEHQKVQVASKAGQ